MPAARPASAFVALNTSTKCCGLPAPEDAMTGTDTDCFICLMSAVSKPVYVCMYVCVCMYERVCMYV